MLSNSMLNLSVELRSQKHRSSHGHLVGYNQHLHIAKFLRNSNLTLKYTHTAKGLKFQLLSMSVLVSAGKGG